MNGAESLVHTLADGGVEVCFANPGTSEMHFVAALDRTRRMRCVLGLFEGVVTGAADGYARMAGKPAVTLLHLAPGLANASANLHNAKKARTPMINVVGDHATRHMAYDAPLSGDVEGAARPFSHWVRTAASAAEVAREGAAALAAATSYPGRIATLVLPADTAWDDAEGPAPALPPHSPEPIDDAQIEATARILEGGQRTLLLVGFSALRDPASLRLAAAIAQRTGAMLLAPTSNPRLERGGDLPFVPRIPYPVDQALELLAPFRHCITVEAAEPVAFFAYPGKPSRVLLDGTEVLALARPEQSGPEALARLAERLGVKASDAPGEVVRRPAPPVTGALDARTIGQAVAALLPEGAIVADEGLTMGREIYPMTRGGVPHSWLSLTGGSIGIGFPFATGAAVACPDRPVLALQADGSGMYTLQALWTQARESLNVTTLVFANRGYQSLHQELYKVGANPGRTALDMLEVDRPALDWVSLARGMGVPGERVEDAAGLVRALRRGFGEAGPYVIEVPVD
jgi:acetolactate synthase-1/2/3 large subunit